MSRTSTAVARRARNCSGNWSSRGATVSLANATVRPGGASGSAISVIARCVARARARAMNGGSSRVGRLLEQRPGAPLLGAQQVGGSVVT